MKRSFFIGIVLLVLLTSCSQTLFHARRYSHLPRVKIEEQPVTQERNSKAVEPETSPLIQLNSSNESIRTVPWSYQPINSKTYTSTFSPNPFKLKKHSGATHLLKQHRNVQTKASHHVKKTKSTKGGSGALNIIGFIIGIVLLVLLLAAMIIALISLVAGPATLAIAITMYYIILGFSLLGLTLCVLGLSLKSSSRGLGIAGVVVNAIVLLSIILALILVAVL